MKEKTLRYPGHIDLIRALRETGFLAKDEIDLRGARVRPLDLTSKLLFPKWTYEPGEEEFTILRVIVEGRRGGAQRRFNYDLYDETDPKTGRSSMARTTGYPCAIVARMLARGELYQPGVFPPELLGRRPGFLDRIIAELARRGVSLSGAEIAPK